MSLNPTLKAVTDRIIARSEKRRGKYLERMRKAADIGPKRGHLSCGNQAHAYAAMGDAKDRLLDEQSPNIGIITAYNDMLSAHQPFKEFPDLIKAAAATHGGTAQVAGGVPAMCDGVTQGQVGMELSLFSRDVIAWPQALACHTTSLTARSILGSAIKSCPV
jgi:phosphogluconate dehydratase